MAPADPDHGRGSRTTKGRACPCIRTRRNRRGHEQSLGLQVAALHPGLELLEHHPLVQRVLVDNDDAIRILGDNVAGVDLQGAVGLADRRQLLTIHTGRQ